MASALVGLSGSSILAICLDFDGTLTNLPDDPDDSVPLRAIMTALRRLTVPSVRVAVISGRPAAFIWERLERLEHLTYIGLYGAETVFRGKHSVVAGAAARRHDVVTATQMLRADPTIVACGAYVEEKGLSVAVHLRRVPDRERWNTPVHDAVTSIGEKCGLETLGGKLVWELRPDLGFDKGTALREFVARTGADAVLVVGDDIGDLAAFRAAHDMRSDRLNVICVAVDSDELPTALSDAADLTVSGPDGVADLLDAIADVRSTADPRRPRNSGLHR